MSLWSRLRDARYALPGLVGRHLPVPDAAWAGRQARLWHKRGRATSFGWFHGEEGPDGVLEANLALIAAMKGCDSALAVKAPALAMHATRIDRLARAGREAGVALVFDAHGAGQADATLALAQGALNRHGAVGAAIPARWRRSMADALRLRDSALTLRIVKGEWADPQGDAPDISAAYLQLVQALAGRGAPVVIATHDPALAAPALDRLIAAGTPCMLEHLRGLPRQACGRIAARRGVAQRLYLPTGPGWWPYAIDKALARPYLPLWMLRDRFGAEMAGR